jgi:hypothetical protein
MLYSGFIINIKSKIYVKYKIQYWALKVVFVGLYYFSIIKI